MADTIVAIATGAGRGGVGVVRLSGEQAAMIAEKIFKPQKKELTPWASHKLIYGFAISEAGARIDNGLAVRMASPSTYTGEDVAEVQVHGSPITLQQIVAAAVCAGARLAEPGEFTKRAFLNGKLDLVQAEAVAELIHAQSEAEAKAARRRIEGKLSKLLYNIRELTVSLLAECEADVDFPEEDLSLATRPPLIEKFKEVQALARALRETYATNQRINGGFVVALIGRPNVGKSSLFNALLQADRAIVTDIPGTTRDVLREELILNGQRVRVVDTAGLRNEGKDEVEKMGIERTRNQLVDADLVLMVIDGQAGWTSEDERFFNEIKTRPHWIISNKSDLLDKARQAAGTTDVSAHTGAGVEGLRSRIGAEAADKIKVPTEGGISNDRQRQLLDDYLSSLDRAETELGRKASPEFVAFELRLAHQAISRILGQDEGIEDILGEIFSRFCIGK